MRVTLTFEFGSPAEAAEALKRLDAAPVISPADRPDVGVPPAPMPAMPAAVDPAAMFAGAAVTVSPPALPAAPVAPPTSPAAPTAPTAGTAPTGAPETDVTGMPWDARIHSATRTANKDGTWRQKRGVDPELVKTVEAEMRAAVGGAPPAPPAPPAAAVPPTPPAPPAAAVPPTPPAPPAAAVPPAGLTFPILMSKLAPAMASDAAGFNAKLAEALAPFKLTSLAQLAARPDALPAVAQAFGV